MNEKLKGLCAIWMAAALAACGGGGDDGISDAPPPAQGAADKYVGAWDTKCITSNFVPGSEKSSMNRFDLPPVDVPIKSGSPGSRLLDGYLG